MSDPRTLFGKTSFRINEQGLISVEDDVAKNEWAPMVLVTDFDYSILKHLRLNLNASSK